ncbi:MAG: sigma-70 family RNA polymerase sigma factor [Planctomycetota bacterium]|jgi:RNA polymerase sigma factor (TIGR02999 family)
MTDVTRILSAIEQGDTKAVDKLLPLVYEELRRLAAKKMSQEDPGQTLQATALVHEAYIRLVGSENRNWNSRTHFFAAAAEAMRRILIDNARRKKSLKHGGGRQRFDLGKLVLSDGNDRLSDDILALDEALEKLAKENKIEADLVKLRYFAGLTGKQAAEVLGISLSRANEHWAYARARLRLEITKGDEIPKG